MYEHLWESMEIHSAQLARCPPSSGFSETAGAALQGSPKLAGIPPPSSSHRPQEPAPRSSGTPRSLILPLGLGRAVGPMGARGRGEGRHFQWGMGISQLTLPFRVQSQSLQNPSVQQGQGGQDLPGPRSQERGSDRTRKSEGSHVLTPSTGLKLQK